MSSVRSPHISFCLCSEMLAKASRTNKHVCGYVKSISELSNHRHAQLSLSGHHLADTTRSSEEFRKLSAGQSVLIHEIGQDLRKRGYPTRPSALLVRLDKTRLGDQAPLIRSISRIHQLLEQCLRLLIILIVLNNDQSCLH